LVSIRISRVRRIRFLGGLGRFQKIRYLFRMRIGIY
jgi:hypothetical protein